MEETPYKELADIFINYSSSQNLLAQEMRLLEEIADAVEVWAILHHSLLNHHYFTEDVAKRQQFNSYIVTHLTVALRTTAMMAPMDKEMQQVCRLVSEAIVNGLARAQISVTEAAFHAHDILLGTKLGGPVGEVNPWIERDELTNVDPNPLSWAIHLYNKPHKNKVVAQNAAHAKAICALGWLMGTDWVVACCPDDIDNAKYSANFIIA
ncbi:hypothetical protein EV175_003467 [Coemansia sp. RSA 1933]|nr:hypothetical protein EV175_003467 [Coemansia sp. RSA 1933]